MKPEGGCPASGCRHEIKHDGFRLMARRDPVGVRLLDPTRDMSGRFCYDAGP
jgi:ATP-dependent DNA ligase